MQKPRFVTLNTHRLAVQRWQQDANAVTFTTVIHGENIGNDIVAEVQNLPISLTIEDQIQHGSARITDRRISGAGPTAVHRIEIRFVPQDAVSTEAPTSIDQKLEAILTELRALRQEVDVLAGKSASAGTNPSAPSGAATLLDFDIPIDITQPD